MAPRVKTSELWRHIALLRTRKALHARRFPEAHQGAVKADELQASADRALRNTEVSEVSEHWAATGWHQPGASARPGDRMGRGWHDAGQPSKLPS